MTSPQERARTRWFFIAIPIVVGAIVGALYLASCPHDVPHAASAAHHQPRH